MASYTDSDGLEKLVSQLRLAVGSSLSADIGVKEKIDVKICKKTRDLKCGDIVVPAGCIRLEEAQQQQLLESLDKLCKADMHRSISKVTRDKYSALAFYLHRANFCKAVFQEIHERKNNYGHAIVQEERSVLMKCVSDTEGHGSLNEGSSLTNLRLRIIASHVKKLLEARGFSVHMKEGHCDLNDLLNSRRVEVGAQRENTKSIPDTNNGDTERNYQHVVKQLCVYQDREHQGSESTETCSEEKKTEEKVKYTPLSDFVHTCTIDLQKIIAEKRLFCGKGGFDKNLHKVTVVSESKSTELLQDVMKLAKELREAALKAGDRCLHIVPQQLAFRQQQVQLLSMTLGDLDIQQNQLVIGPVSCKGKDTPVSGDQPETARQFYGTRYQQMKEASDMRYGTVSGDVDNNIRVSRLTAASIILDILGTTAHSPLCLDVSCSDRGAESRLGAFVLYNTARLATLLEHFAQGVSKGIYPDLPPVEDVEFTLLREEEDWELVYLYIAAFPDVLQQAVEVISPADGNLLAQIHTHKVANFLAPFCKCLSAHYSRYHILTAGEPHLLPLMYARLYLMKSAHQVLLNCLDLIGVEPLSYL